MASKRNTKMVLASLLATSAIVPAVTASAEVGGDITRSGEAVTTSEEVMPISEEVTTSLINFTVTDKTGMLSRYLPTEGELVEIEGKYFISFEISEQVANMIKSATVNGESIVVAEAGLTYIVVPVNEDLEPVNGELSLFVAAINQEMSTEFTLTPEVLEEDEEPSQEVDEETDEEGETDEGSETVDTAPLKYLQAGYGNIAEGEYEVGIDFVNLETGEAGYDAMARHIEQTATLVVEEGEYYLDIQASESSNGMIIDYYLLEDEETTLESIEGSKDEYPHTVRVPLTDINGYTEMAVHVYAERNGTVMIDKPYPFGIMVNPGQALTELVPTYVYKDGSKELSIMQKTYLSSTSAVTSNEDGTYSVEITFPKGQFLVNDLIFDGQTIAESDSYEDGDDTIKIFTLEVEDISKIYNATFDLDVPGFYKAKHTAQIQFGGKQNPFGDITKSWAYSNVVSLYNKGIFKAADKFNPANNLERGHFALMLARAFDLKAPETTLFTDLRSDVEEQEAIKALNGYGIINGKTSTTFGPADKILRYEAALMINRLLDKYDLAIEDKGVSFNDISGVFAEGQTAILNLANLGIINGKGAGKFDPQGTLTREEMAKILDNALKIIEKQ